MGVLLLNADHKIDSALQEDRTEVVTLLVPKRTLLLYPEDRRKSLPKLIPQLLRTYAKHITSTARLGKKAGKIMYQPSVGPENMERINVRLGTGSWALLGVLAQAHGVSRCFLFNYLLWLEEIGVGDSIVEMMNVGGPTFHKNYSYILDLNLSDNRITRYLRCEPENIFYVYNPPHWFDY
ncbi:DUF1564 domain-containing protein [Leptospira gomenensis]|uniref:DUF1564 domain-containing protein n=1 Tax=Leptospira gomenensis TaxID=2484974 RepID=A0A5F1YGB0_9LEPT|nr:DUF1564 domain-containing protein [Leptospira gomenensis]TGK37467.1 DUF1564 domain-containing protein [Leptospira gomenensis]TGK40825.1 DUF1564 domain-containing protein [Leptospira gomenensis]TGK43052.1 DUF1564 domain-containing protein [Leptospira gomenensis]TGK54316.1 DUF1564 domain-containing protein [Leptospira gomenensis]